MWPLQNGPTTYLKADIRHAVERIQQLSLLCLQISLDGRCLSRVQHLDQLFVLEGDGIVQGCPPLPALGIWWKALVQQCQHHRGSFSQHCYVQRLQASHAQISSGRKAVRTGDMRGSADRFGKMDHFHKLGRGSIPRLLSFS